MPGAGITANPISVSLSCEALARRSHGDGIGNPCHATQNFNQTSVGRNSINYDEIIRGRLAITAGREFELNLLSLVQGGQSGTFDGRNMHKGIF